MIDASVSVQEAQAEIDGPKVAEILRDFQHNFRGVYPDYVLARGVGPEQAMIGLAIKRGHLLTLAQSDARVGAALREAFLNIRELNMSGEDENGQRWANSDLIEQEIVAALALLPTATAALARALERMRERCAAECDDTAAEYEKEAAEYPQDASLCRAIAARLRGRAKIIRALPLHEEKKP